MNRNITLVEILAAKKLRGDKLEDIIYQSLQPDQENLVSAMVVRTFERFVAPGYSPQGVEEFMKYAAPERIAARAKKNYLTLAAWAGEAA